MTEPEEVWRTRRWLMRAVACLSILALIGVATTAVFVVDQRSYNECQREYNDATQAVVKERAGASDLDRQAILVVSSSTVALVDIILRPDAQPEEKLAAVKTWRDAQSRANLMLAQSDDQRAQHQLPSPPRC